MKIVLKLRYGSTLIYFGEGCIARYLSRYIEGGWVAVITGRKSARVSGALDDVGGVLREKGVEYIVIDRVTPNPSIDLADEIAREVWEYGAQAIIAIGGGSVIDVAKFVSVISYCGGRAGDYLYWRRRSCGKRLLIAVNLTHGTGSEIDRYAVLTNTITGEKRGISIVYPDVSFDDPRYTATLPRSQTIYTLLDAFYHVYEASTSLYANMFTYTLSKDASHLIVEYSPKTLDQPNNIGYREKLLYASMIAGIAIDQSGTHLIHALEHALSGLNPGLPHGAGLGIIGPRAIKYIHKAVPEQSALMLKPLNPGIKPLSTYSGEAEETMKRFYSEINFDERLSDYGFDRSDLEKAVELVFNGLKYLLDGSPFNLTREIARDILFSGF